MSKAEATRLADALAESFPAFGDGTRSDRERLALESAALLRQWPDGEPVGWVVESIPQSGYVPQPDGSRVWREGADYSTYVITNVQLKPNEKVYAAPPDAAARIAELEAALKVAGEALLGVCTVLENIGGEHVTGLERSDKVLEEACAALQRIKETQR